MKLIKALVVMLVAVGMILPAVAVAEDRLSLSGQMRVRAFHEDFDSANSTETWANQRLRIAGKLAVAEGVSVTFRTDITEGTNWGDSSTFGSGPGNPERSNGFGHARSGSQQQWDRAHLDLEKGMFHLRAGQQYVGTFGTFAVDTQDSGLRFDVKTEFAPISTYVIVDNDNASKAISDDFLFGVTVSPKFGDVKTKFLGAGYNQGNGSEVEVYVLGVSADAMLGPVKLFGEFDFFTGDAAVDGLGNSQDAYGTQLFLDGSMAATDALSFGGQFFYAAGDDEDVQYTRLGNGFNGWDPIYDVGTSLSNEEIALWAFAGETFDFSNVYGANGGNQGVVGGRLYGSFKASDSLSFGISGAYLTVEDDWYSDDELTAFAGGMVYKVAENASFQLQLQHSNYDSDVLDDDTDIFSAGTGLFVNF